MESTGLRAALEYAAELQAPNIVEVNGKQYTDKHLTEIAKEKLSGTIECSTLDAIIGYLKRNVDERTYNVLVHVVSPKEVEVLSQLNGDSNREVPIRAKAILPDITLGQFMDRLTFNIQMQTKFVPTGEDYLAIMAYVGTAEDHTVKGYGDDGVSQSVVVKTGLTQKEEVLVPNPVTLQPFRTFTEVEQPASKFVFRMDNSRDITAALFEADGKGWRNQAMKNIQTYLEENLKELIEDGKVTVIA